MFDRIPATTLNLPIASDLPDRTVGDLLSRGSTFMVFLRHFG